MSNGTNFIDLPTRFLMQWERDPVTGCHLWTGAVTGRGYGSIKHRYASKLAHRVAYELYRGPILPGMLVCHICDTPRCVNPDHLFIGSPTDNLKDMMAKGRDKFVRGVAHPNARLTEEQVLEIFASDSRYKALAARYDISAAYISEIKTGRKWKHLTREASKRAEQRGYRA